MAFTVNRMWQEIQSTENPVELDHIQTLLDDKKTATYYWYSNKHSSLQQYIPAILANLYSNPKTIKFDPDTLTQFNKRMFWMGIEVPLIVYHELYLLAKNPPPQPLSLSQQVEQLNKRIQQLQQSLEELTYAQTV